MSWQNEYARKLTTVDDIVDRFVFNGALLYAGGLSTTGVVLQEVVRRCAAHELRGIELYGSWVYGDIRFGDIDVEEEYFRSHSVFTSWNDREGMKSGCVDFVPLHFAHVGEFAAALKPDVIMLQVSPPDENGLVCIGPNGNTASALPHCKHAVAQVNKFMPRVTGEGFNVPVSSIDAFVEHDDLVPLYPHLKMSVSPEAQHIADIIVEHINDGDCIQLGVGSIPKAIGRGLFGHRHLGIYSELYDRTMRDLQEAGVVDNSRKTFMPGVSVAGFAEFHPDLFAYLDGNPNVAFLPFDKMCNASYVARNDNYVSVNSALAVDVTGQVGAESIGTRQFSGTGGQVGFVKGAQMAKGGRSFIAFESVAHTKNGPVSKIRVTLAPGTVVTTLRTDVQFLVTEHGCADVRFCSVPERVRRIVSIAHPDFRDQLLFEAKQAGLLY